VLRAHIDPAIGGTPIAAIRREDIKALIAGRAGRRASARRWQARREIGAGDWPVATARYQNCPIACGRHARIGRPGRVMRRLGQAASPFVGAQAPRVLRCQGCSGVKGAQVSRKRSWLRPHPEH
jgi:hypothetical protein